MKKKNIILTSAFILALVLLTVLSGITYKTVKGYFCSDKCVNSILNFQTQNAENVFSINKITYYSSGNANIETNSNSSFTISDLYQYTDIAIFINPNSEKNTVENTSNTYREKNINNLTAKNTLKSVVISDINFSLKPSVGTPCLYYKNLNNFAKPTYSAEDTIKDTITFNTTSENILDYSKPILFNNCANPITLCYVNSKIQNTYTLSNQISNIAHNGSLLKKCNIALSSINCKLSFDITITNNLNEVYSCPITLNIPLSTENATIYDGSLTIKDSVDYKFIKIN